MGLSYDALFPGRFIKAGEFNGKPVTLTIKSVFLDGLETETGATEQKAIVTFEETKREWVLIKTNAQCLVAMWGDQSDDWIGKKVTLHAERDPSGLSDSGLCIRVKGSPLLTAPMNATIKLPRRKPVTRKLVPTGTTTTTATDAHATTFGDDDGPNSDGRVAVCASCHVSMPVTPDVTDADLAAMKCECGGALTWK